MDNKEEMCQFCKSFGYFRALIKNGESTEDAYHEAVRVLMENALQDIVEDIASDIYEDIAENAYEAGWDEGYKRAYRSIAEELNETVDMLDELDGCNGDCDCDCE